MVKRSNELSNVKREDYDDVMEAISLCNEPTGLFSKCTPEILRKRRLVTASRPSTVNPTASSSAINPFSACILNPTSPSPSIAVRDAKEVKCAQTFVGHILASKEQTIDMVSLDRFINEYSRLYYLEVQSSIDSKSSLPTEISKLKSFKTSGGLSFTRPSIADLSAQIPASSFSRSAEVKDAAAAANTAASPKDKGSGVIVSVVTNDEKNDETTAHESVESDHHTIYSCNTKVLRANLNKYIARGVLKIEQHKQTSKFRIVVRNELGRVLFNVSLTCATPFDKVVIQNADPKKKPTYVVMITSILDGGSPEVFKLITRESEYEALYNELEKIIKN